MKLRRLFAFVFLLPVALAFGPDRSVTCTQIGGDTQTPLIRFDLEWLPLEGRPEIEQTQLALLSDVFSTFNTINQVLASPGTDTFKGEPMRAFNGRPYFVFDWIMGDYDGVLWMPRDFASENSERDRLTLVLTAPPGSDRSTVDLDLECIAR